MDDDRGHQVSAYLADANGTGDKQPMYNPQLGLAVEALKDGMTIDNLWSVV